MNFKDILVHIDNRPTCASRLAVAIDLARQQQSLLTGIYAVPRPHYLGNMREVHVLENQAREQFEQATKETGLETSWISVDTYASGLDIVQAINLHAHYRDLLVISQTDEEAADQSIPGNLPEYAVLGSGRPVLIVPYAGEYPGNFKKIIHAWRGGPESARALHDAMPVLEKADEISVITIQGKEGDEYFEKHQSDICQHMARYNLPIACEKRNCGGLSVGDLLLNRCADSGAELLVMGATRQHRRGNLTLGDTGRHLLKYMTLPVLMSHA